jgi:pimeloyl-ACP methyl ester carboxylesterase
VADDIKFVSANGLQFAYHEKGEGRLVLLLHGFPDNASTYVHTMTDLADAGYRAVAPYLRGYAPTEIPSSGTVDPLTLGRDVEALIRSLEPGGKAFLVGMDWGGTSIQAALAVCPELVEAAVVMNAAHPAALTPFTTDPRQTRSVFHFWFFQMDVAPAALAASELAMVDYLWKLWSPNYEAGEHIKSVRNTLASPGVLSAVLSYYGALYRSALNQEFPLAEIHVPTLSIFGSLDPTVTYSHLEEPFFVGPYRRDILEGVGHWPHLERREHFSQLVLDWFASN